MQELFNDNCGFCHIANENHSNKLILKLAKYFDTNLLAYYYHVNKIIDIILNFIK
ncbi:hypothetical protein CPAV1605_442 [seawater metagenome]|uniref:Uncharacterized protein n=1 Tax=seawater metagenome TaxID=1561972 RepID=A0A5E8CI17_9ZZZZ